VILRRFGYEAARQNGRHVRMVCPGRMPVAVPMRKPLKRGTLRSILRTADIEVAGGCATSLDRIIHQPHSVRASCGLAIALAESGFARRKPRAREQQCNLAKQLHGPPSPL
jgi:predicted RNA binding protein YcfA (HicA-like mRNA interferase family)